MSKRTRKSKINFLKFTELWNNGTSSILIAKELHCHKDYVRQIRKKLNLVKRPYRKPFPFNNDLFIQLWNSGYSYSKMSNIFHCSPLTIYNHRKLLNLHGRKSEQNRKEFLKRRKRIFSLYRKGKDFINISRECNYPVDLVKTILGETLLNECRKIPKCPFKALLPENKYEEKS